MSIRIRILSLAVWLAGLMTGPALAQDSQQLTVASGQTAPDFTLRSLDGQFYTLSRLKEQGYVLVLFWAVDCVYCHAQLQDYKKLYRQYREQGLHWLAINVGDESVEKLSAYVDEQQIDYPVLTNRQHNLAVARAYDIQVTPTLVLIAPDGNIVYRGHQPPPLAQWLAQPAMQQADVSGLAE